MNVFSYEFFFLWAITLLLYFTIGKHWQWQLLLVVSAYFYLRAVAEIPWILLVVWVGTYLAGKYVDVHKDLKGKIVCLSAIILCVICLFIGRVSSLIVTVGNSYFILKAIGYLVDIYRGKKSEGNIFKYLLYLIFWPTILEGPFNRIEDFENNINKTFSFDYENFIYGLQRFIWGVFKKVVISERLGAITASILNDPCGKGGVLIILGVLLFALQLYTDFSGFMDMMIGISTTFGIKLPENFRQPFFSRSISEFWRRWHITLGLWFRDYVMFTFSSSHLVKRFSKNIRKKNKTIGKLIPLFLGTWIVWILTGVWHGFSINYLIWGMYYSILMCISQVVDIVFYSKRDKKDSTMINILRIIRTVLFVLIADTLICVKSMQSVYYIWHEILFNTGGNRAALLTSTGITLLDAVILGIALLCLFVDSVCKEKNESILILLNKAPVVIRWIVYYVLIYVILLFGLYDAKYDVNQFMYMQF